MDRARGGGGGARAVRGSAATDPGEPMSGPGRLVLLPGPARRKINIGGPEEGQAAARGRAAPAGAGAGAGGCLGRAAGPAAAAGQGGERGRRGPRRPLGDGRGAPRCCAPRGAAGAVGGPLSVGGDFILREGCFTTAAAT